MSTANSLESPLIPTTGKPFSGWMRLRLPAQLGADLLRLSVLATACVGTALAVNQLREPPLPLVYASKQARIEQVVARTNASEPAKELAAVSSVGESLRVIGLGEFRELVQAKRTVVLDARPEIFHRLGHVPGAISLSREEFERDYAKQRTLLESKRSQPIAVYCSSTSCEDSQLVAEALVRLSYRHVLVFKGGWDEWTQAGLPEEHQ